MSERFILLLDSLRHACRRLDRLGGQRLRLHAVDGRLIPLGSLADDLGEVERPMIGAVVGIHFEDPGHPQLRLIFAVEVAALALLATVAAGAERARDPGMAESVLQEMGNIGASAIANHLSGHLGVTAHVSAPDLLHERWGSLLAAVVGSFSDPRDQLPALTTELTVDGRHFSGSVCLVADRHLEQPGPGNAIRTREIRK